MKTILSLLISVLLMTNTQSQTNRSVNDARGIPIGISAPLFKALDADSSEFSLSDALLKGPVVLIFYRGYWCPVCNRHLGQVQDSLQQISNKGATVVAVSPQKPEYLTKMADKTDVKFRLLYDENYTIADAYDVSFTPEKKQLLVYNTMLNAKLKETQSDESQRLPIPATYIINQEGIIVWRQFDPDYKNRSSVQDILNNLPLK